MPVLLPLTWFTPMARCTQTQGKIQFTGLVFHIKEFPVSQGNLWNSVTMYGLFAFAGCMPKLNGSSIQRWRTISWRLRLTGLKGFDIDAGRGQWNRPSILASQWAVLAKKPDLYILGEIWHSSQQTMAMSSMRWWTILSLKVSRDYFLRGHRRRNASLRIVASLCYRQQISEVMFNRLPRYRAYLDDG